MLTIFKRRLRAFIINTVIEDLMQNGPIALSLKIHGPSESPQSLCQQGRGFPVSEEKPLLQP